MVDGKYLKPGGASAGDPCGGILQHERLVYSQAGGSQQVRLRSRLLVDHVSAAHHCIEVLTDPLSLADYFRSTDDGQFELAMERGEHSRQGRFENRRLHVLLK